MLVTGFFVFIFSKDKKILANTFTYLILFQMFFCLFHVFFVQIRFNYPLFQAIIASRSFLNYLSFFYFVLLLDKPQKVFRVMEVLNWIMVVVLILSVVNYFHPFLHHKWAEGHNERAGVKRAFIPAMSVLSMLAIWSFANMFSAFKRETKWSGFSFLYIAAHIFRQTRMRLFGIFFTLICLALYKRNFTNLLLAIVLMISSAIAIDSFLSTNIISSNIDLTVEKKNVDRLRQGTLRRTGTGNRLPGALNPPGGHLQPSFIIDG